MKRTFTETTTYTNEELREAQVKLYVYGECKYTEKIENEVEVRYTGLVAWDIIEGGEEAERIEIETGDTDEFHEYLVLHFEDGTTSTFRNSHCDMFIR